MHREVDVDIKDQRDQDYVKPKPKVVAFSGSGRKLGRYYVCVRVSQDMCVVSIRDTGSKL